MQNQKKNLTVNDLPKDIVDQLKIAAISLDCKIQVLVEVILRRALVDIPGLYADVHKLRKAQEIERKELSKVTKQARKLEKRLDGATT